MPTIVQIGNVKVQIFTGDHNPPHFHIVTPDNEAMVRISDFTIIAGYVDRRNLDKAINWAIENKRVLENEWKRLNTKS